MIIPYIDPSEAYTLILQVTLGCSHNGCTFCDMYKSKKFKIKSEEELKLIREARNKKELRKLLVR